MNKFLATGANGFVGQVLCAELLRRGYTVCGAVRNQAALATLAHGRSCLVGARLVGRSQEPSRNKLRSYNGVFP